MVGGESDFEALIRLQTKSHLISAYPTELAKYAPNLFILKKWKMHFFVFVSQRCVHEVRRSWLPPLISDWLKSENLHTFVVKMPQLKERKSNWNNSLKKMPILSIYYSELINFPRKRLVFELKLFHLFFFWRSDRFRHMLLFFKYSFSIPASYAHIHTAEHLCASFKSDAQAVSLISFNLLFICTQNGVCNFNGTKKATTTEKPANNAH